MIFNNIHFLKKENQDKTFSNTSLGYIGLILTIAYALTSGSQSYN